MAEEKILEEELLDEEELENVAGGSGGEIVSDARRLHKMGLFSWKGTSFYISSVSKVIKNLGKELGMDIQYKWHRKGGAANEYIIDGQSFSRKEFWEIIDEARAAQKN